MASSVLSLVVLVLLLGPVSSQNLDPAMEDLIQRNAEFGARLYRAVASRTDDNVFLCPLTLSAGLMALLSSTSGPTQEQLLQGLTLNGLDPQNLPDQFEALGNAVFQKEAAQAFQWGVAIFPDQRFQVSASYLELVQRKFGGAVQSVTYSETFDAIDTINRWAQSQTRDRVQEVVSFLNQQTQLLIATTAAYQARFIPAFNSSSTQDERFYVDKYHVVMVPMMFRADKYFLAYDRSVKAGVLQLQMAYGAAMLVVLPDEGVDITAVEDEISSEKIRTWVRQLKKTKLEVQLPRFLLEQSYSLKNILQRLDIVQVFQDDADIINMGGATGPKLTEVYHKSVITVDESSNDITSEGGVTTFSSPPPRLTFNRPFIFIIYQQATSCLLFMGRVMDPTKK